MLCAALVAAGCRAQREIWIRTEPPGALIRLDDELVGRTPIDVSFEQYGTRRVTAYLDGYRTVSSEVEIETPWWDVFPLDFVSEVLLPFGWADVHRVELALEPEVGEVSEGELRAVLDRAEELRRGGPAGPQTAVPQGPQSPNTAPPAGSGAPPREAGPP